MVHKNNIKALSKRQDWGFTSLNYFEKTLHYTLR